MHDLDKQAEASYLLHMQSSRERSANLAERQSPEFRPLFVFLFSIDKPITPFAGLPDHVQRFWKDLVIDPDTKPEDYGYGGKFYDRSHPEKDVL